MISKILIERAIDMVPIASDDVTRFNITGVHILAKDGNVTLTATNGHMLMTREMPGVQCPDGIFMLRKDKVKFLKALIKDNKYRDEFPCIVDNTGALLIGDASVGSIAVIDKMDGEYPDIAHVIPKQYPNCAAITLNAEYLLALADALRDGEKRRSMEARIVFDPADPGKPILVQCKNAEGITAVLMPIRDDGTKAMAVKFVIDRLEDLSNESPATETAASVEAGAA